ncbi:MAG: hypothetical protein ACE369_11070 [Roseovarius sp.]
MKKRWMKSVIATSQQATPELPFARSVRLAKRTASKPKALRIA